MGNSTMLEPTKAQEGSVVVNVADSTPRQKRPYHRRNTSQAKSEATTLPIQDGVADVASGEAKKLKIVVYAICKNESKFVKRWMDSMKEADAVVVLDTGSNDDTVELLKQEGAEVETKTYGIFRFDEARNDSIDIAKRLHPDADLLVCTDLDEYFISGWRGKIEAAWISACSETRKSGIAEPTTVQYEYVWNFREDGSDGTKFWYEKIHSPSSGARWTHPVHEVLSYPSKKVLVRVPNVRLEHHADASKSRGQYLGLLEMSVREEPNDDRNSHYLCREYMFRCHWDECIAEGKRHLTLPTARWKAERANSMRFIARSYGEKGDKSLQQIWLWRAVVECSEQREAALDLAELLYKEKDWQGLLQACEACLSVKAKTMSYITKAEAWGYRPYDLYSIALWFLHRPEDAKRALDEALKFAPDNTRLLQNYKIMTDFIEKMKEKEANTSES